MLLMLATLPLTGDRAHHGLRESYWLAEYQESPQLLELRHKGNALFRGGEYVAASRTYEEGYAEAMRLGDRRSALRFLNNLGGVDYQLLRYRDAIKAYLEARDLAQSQLDQETLAAIYFNLSSLYDQMGEVDAATESAERGLELPAGITKKFRSSLLLHSALIHIRRKNWDLAIQAFSEAIDAARVQRDIRTEAQAWNELGNALMECGRPAEAERALLECFRLRELSHDDRLHFSYESLGELRLRQKDAKGALALFDRAIQSAAPSDRLALWRPLYGRGRAHLAAAHVQAAYADFGSALENLKSWGAEVLPADDFRVSSEGDLHDVYSAYIELGARLYRQTGDRRYALESFGAAEESRAASLRALWRDSGLARELPSDYWSTLSDLHQAESSQLRNSSSDGATQRLRLKLMEMEARAGLELPRALADPDFPREQLLERTRGALGADEVFLSFHSGDSESCLWAITREAFEFQPLPPSAELRRDVQEFVKAVTNNSSAAAVRGAQLYDRLFGSLSTGLRHKPVWVVAPDGPLFDLPFAALVDTSTPGSRRYIIEDHAIRIVPGISALFRSPSPESAKLFIAVGDPIYNRADPRWSSRTSMRKAWAKSGVRSPDRILELPRLIGSSREVESCARMWQANGNQVVVLEGADANRHNLADALRRNPSVLHVAAHMVFPRDETGPGMLALGLEPGNQVELLSATEVARMRAQPALVVLDGCSSARGAILPGAGLMGMTRAWLAAGARAVIATRWATGDLDSGELFASLYRLYFAQPSRQATSFGRLLREAQLAELHAGGAHAAPAYWAAYFCMETN